MLNKFDILRVTNQGLDIFKHYLNNQVIRLGRNFLNPLYTDTNASCNIYLDKITGCYKIKDFGNDEYSGDCFHFVAKVKGLDCTNTQNFIEILAIINQDLGLGLLEENSQTIINEMHKSQTVTPPTQEPPSSKYTFAQKPFSERELAYWNTYGIGINILKQYKVISLKSFQSENKDGKSYTLNTLEAEPIFGYQGKRSIKIYRPFSQIRFLYGGTLNDNYCFGLEQLPSKGDLLFITGGEKDVLSLAAHRFPAICFNSETSIIPKALIRKLANRFKHIVLLYDVDKTGIESSLKQQNLLKELGVKRLILPLSGTKEEKDISDYFHLKNSPESLIQLFQGYLEQVYEDTLSLLKPCEIDFNNPPQKAQMMISVNNVPLGTQGNLLCITGGEGTGKSHYVGALIAGSIAPENATIDCLGLQINTNNKNEAVLLYDTEQSEEQLYKNLLNVLTRSQHKEKPQSFHAFSLTGMSRKERLLAIMQSMDTFYYQYGGIHLVAIDGIADLVRTTNDEAESVELIDELYRLAGIYNTCIVCVLHFVPNGLKLRGHLGSELQRKAAAILSIELDSAQNGISLVKALKVRDGSPLDVPITQFAWDKEKGMHRYRGEKPKEDREQRKINELTIAAKQLFNKQNRYTYTQLCTDLQATLDVKERTAKSYIQFMREEEIIQTDPNNSTYFMLSTNQ